MLERQPISLPPPGTAVVTDKGLSGEDTEAFFAGPDLGLTLIRPARKDAATPALAELAAPAGRGNHLDAEEPARHRTPRQTRPCRPVVPVGLSAGSCSACWTSTQPSGPTGR
jgi:hypothetical protein